MKTTKRPYSRTTIICAHILKHLMTSVPMTVGFFAVLGSVGSYELCRIGMAQFWIQTILGFGLAALGAIILNYFES